MEFERVFVGVAVALVGIVAILGLANFYNGEYGTDAGNSFNSTLTSVAVLSNITYISNTAGANAQPSEGSGADSTQGDLIQRSLRIITVVPTLLGLAPDLISEAAAIIGVPEIYVQVATAIFVFSFVMLLAYLLLLGVKKLV